MLEKQLIEEFRQRLIAQTAHQLEEEGWAAAPLALDAALAEVVLGDLEEAGALSEHEACPYLDTVARGRCKILAYSLPEESSRLELITAAYVPTDSGDQLSGGELSALTGQAARFFHYVARGELARFSGHALVEEAVRRITQALPQIDEVRVHVLTNAMVRDRVVNDVNIAGRPVEFSVWDLERLYRASGEEVTRDRIEVDFSKLLGAPIPVLEMKPPPEEYQTFLLVLPGEVVFKLYEEYGPLLFEFNVRSFLQARGTVNKGLRETLRAQPERFLAYNNGLTATADEIEVGTVKGETVIHRLRGLQIVNGAQTTASIHRARKTDKIDVSKVAVSMKLTRVSPDKLGEFVPLIAKFANTQNPVQLADLSANNEFHIAMGRLSEEEWAPGEESRWFYERARGAYEVARLRLGSTPAKRRIFDLECPKTQCFSKTDLAKVWMTSWLQPHVVSRGAQRNFAAFMAELPERYPSDWRPGRDFYRQTVALLILFRACQSATRKASVPSYGANVVTFMLAKFLEDYAYTLSVETIWEMQSVSAELSSLLMEWAPFIHAAIIDGAGVRNVTEFSKKEECWERIKAEPMQQPEAPLPEFEGSQRPMAAAVEPAGNVEALEKIVALDGPQWASIFAWAVQSNTVTPFELKVTHTVLGYALGGWQHLPSEKQCPFAVRVLDKAEAAGVPFAGR